MYFCTSPYFIGRQETNPIKSSLTDYIDCDDKPYTLFQWIDTAQNYRGMWVSRELRANR